MTIIDQVPQGAKAKSRWNLKSAWVCFGYQFAAGIVSLPVFKPDIFRGATTSRFLTWVVLLCALDCLIMYLYLGCRSLGEFCCTVGLAGRVSKRSLLMVPAGLCIGVASRLLNHTLPFRRPSLVHLLGLGSLITLLPEEIMLRGYAYPAIRTRFSIMGAIANVLFMVLVTHIQIIRSPGPNVAILLMNILACLLREYGQTIFPAVCLHLGYNAAGFL